MAGGLGKLSAQVIQKTVSEVSGQQNVTKVSDGSSPFKQMLDSLNSGESFAQQLGMTNQDIGFPVDQLNPISGKNIEVNMASLEVGLDKPKGIDRVVDLLSQVNDDQLRMHNTVQQVLMSGKRFSNQELLAIQAYVFNVAQTTELVVKTADQGVSSLKAVMNTNIQ